jgi:hypothetical protein
MRAGEFVRIRLGRSGRSGVTSERERCTDAGILATISGLLGGYPAPSLGPTLGGAIAIPAVRQDICYNAIQDRECGREAIV